MLTNVRSLGKHIIGLGSTLPPANGFMFCSLLEDSQRERVHTTLWKGVRLRMPFISQQQDGSAISTQPRPKANVCVEIT